MMLSRHKSRSQGTVSNSDPFSMHISEDQLASELAKLRGIPRQALHLQPRLNGHPLDLVKLYNEVAIRGGSKKVTSLSLWDEVADSLSLMADCVNIGQGVKNVFQNYLGQYERVQRSLDGQSSSDLSQVMEIDLTNDSADNLQAVENHLRHRWNLSTDLIESVEYRALLLALQSGLPNELDFAMNTILLMSSQPNGFDLGRCPQILPLVLSSVGIYSTGYCSYWTLKDAWRSQCSRNFRKFWESVVTSSYGQQFLDPGIFSEKRLSNASVDSLDSCPLSFRDTMTYHDVEGFRVQLVAMVLRNLVVNACGNSVILSQEPDVFRFICLCIYSSHTALRQLGLDTLSYIHFPVFGPLSSVLNRLLPELLSSQDRVDTSRGLRIIRHLCESPVRSHQGRLGSMHIYSIETSSRNIGFLTQSLSRCLIGLVLQLTCLRDLHLLVLALDALLALSTQGAVLCESLIDPKHQLIPILVSYLTFEAQSFGSEGLIRIRVMQVPGANSANPAVPSVPPPQQTSTRRVLEKTPAITTAVTLAPLLAPPKKDSALSSLVTSLLLGPAPQPPTGCYAVPVPVTSASLITRPTSSHEPSSLLLSAPISKLSTPVIISNATAPLSTKSVAGSTDSPSSSTALIAPAPAQHPVVSRPAIFPVVVAATPKQLPSPSPLTNGDQMDKKANPVVLSGSQVSRHLFQSSPPVNTLPKPYADAPKDKRDFALFWLNKNYEVHPQSSFPRVQIYAEYQKAHQAQFESSSGGALSAGDFHSIVKLVFPPVEQVKVLVPNGNVEIHYNKLKHVDAPEPVEQALGVQHMLGTCLANQNAETKGLAVKNSSSLKVNQKRSANSPVIVPTAAEPMVKQIRLANEAMKSNGGGGGSFATTLVNGATTSHPLKLVATSVATFMDGLVPISSKGPIELAPNGIHVQQPVIAASTIVFSSMDGKCMVNGITAGGESHGAAGISANTKLNDSPQSAMQFRALLPITTTTTPTTLTTPANKASYQVSPQFKPSLVVQSSVVANGGGTEVVAANPSPAPTLTCLGTALISATGVGGCGGVCTPQQVFVYSIPQQTQLSASPTNSLLPTVAHLHATAVSTDTPRKQHLPSAKSVCQWEECRKTFPSSDRLFSHIYSAHFISLRNHQETTCKWLNCRECHIRRSPLSLLDHLRVRHCSTTSAVARTVATSKASHVASADVSATSLLTPLVTAKPSLSATRATLTDREFFQSLRADFVPSTSEATMHEGPVTKHVRLTAALTLHNLVTYSPVARSQLRAYESLLCEVAFSGTEASTTLAKCLALLSPPPPHSPPRRRASAPRSIHRLAT